MCAGVWGPETAELGVLPVTWLAPKGCWDSAALCLGLGEGAMFQGAEGPASAWPHSRQRQPTPGHVESSQQQPTWLQVSEIGHTAAIHLQSVSSSTLQGPDAAKQVRSNAGK